MLLSPDFYKNELQERYVILVNVECYVGKSKQDKQYLEKYLSQWLMEGLF